MALLRRCSKCNYLMVLNSYLFDHKVSVNMSIFSVSSSANDLCVHAYYIFNIHVCITVIEYFLLTTPKHDRGT